MTEVADRTAQFLDPPGHRWAPHRHLHDVTGDELAGQPPEVLA